ncbi:hypothetical protein K2173_015535 [Erythroxylum novogranatense]|uniref:HMA domain-containing protein n=1 Tax=Erythroxylum novogranatense TaxID=1862640 RepID=A0AAV8SS06_9ROSI|nr:hypothetical protein K2173_015535 [Erythroxylum novogranatense]
MKGFMCQSTAATAVCSVADPRSVILPRNSRPEARMSHLLDNTNRFINNAKYSRLAESRRFSSSIKRRENAEQKPKPIQKPADQVFQVVVMRVALHCQGCAGKVKKHLSKMEGVTSFSIDLETKRVTVMGHVSPVVVVESISKVKRAELWPC